MTDKITLTNLVNLQNQTTAVNAINANNAVLTAAMDNTVSRDGTQPNSMNANLDMNSNHLLNLPSPSSGNEPVRLVDLAAVMGGTATFNGVPTGGATGTVLTKNSSTNYDTSWLAIPAPTIPTLWAIAGGTSDAITGAYTPVNTSLTDGLVLYFRATASNTTTTPTFSPDGLTAHVITKTGGMSLAIGDITSTSEIGARYNLAHTRWEILDTLPSTTSATSLIFTTATAIASTTIPSAVTGFTTLGYHTVGDGGAAIYLKVGGSTTGGLVSADGANWQVFPNANGVLTPEMFGAYGDGTHDDTTAVQNCVTVTGSGCTISNGNPTASYLVSSTINFTKPVKLLFTPGSGFQPASGIGASTVLNFIGSPSGLVVPTIIEGLFVKGNSATRFGGSALYFDTTTAGNYFANLVIRNVFLQAGSSTTGLFGITFFNNTTNNPNGGVFCSSILESEIQDGIEFFGSGDSLCVRDCLIPQITGGNNKGIYVNLVAGAGTLVIDHINLSQASGLIIDQAYSPVIINSEFEVQSLLQGTGAMVNINGGVGTVFGPKFRNNQVQAQPGFGTPLLMTIAVNVVETIIDGNNFSTPTSYTPISNACTTLQLGPNYWNVGAAAHISGVAPANTYGGG